METSSLCIDREMSLEHTAVIQSKGMVNKLIKTCPQNAVLNTKALVCQPHNNL